jgi:LAO/AO transport system kinase
VSAYDDTELAERVLRGERRALSKLVTLLESTRSDHRARADALLTALTPHSGRSLRIGISGVPGAGKSTFIEALGLWLVERGHQVAVLAIDPSSARSGGAILGDKTRMERLSVHPRAFVRPSPSAGTWGGVAAKTRESMLAFEAAGYDIVLVETVGVGQSETAVATMTDLFVLLQLPNAGDDLQAMKKGVVELADLIVVNKADLDPGAARLAQGQIESALRLFGATRARVDESLWFPEVICKSALADGDWSELWDLVARFRTVAERSGAFHEKRRSQALAWLWDLIRAELESQFRADPAVASRLDGVEHAVRESQVAPTTAARGLLEHFRRA